MVSDALGRFIMKDEIRNMKYEIEDGVLSEGIYFINIVQENNKTEFHSTLVIE